jgi:hypothetical protein
LNKQLLSCEDCEREIINLQRQMRDLSVGRGEEERNSFPR